MYATARLPGLDVAMGTREVSVGLWTEVTGRAPPRRPGCLLTDAPDTPLTCMTWPEAVDFANRLSLRNGLVPVYHREWDNSWTRVIDANGYRLPTIGEWAAATAQDPAWALLSRWAADRSDPCVGPLPNLGGSEAPAAAPLPCADPWPGLAPATAIPLEPSGIAGLLGNVAELLSCTHDQDCAVVGGSWLTGRDAFVAEPWVPWAGTGRPAARTTMRQDEGRPDVGFRLVQQQP